MSIGDRDNSECAHFSQSLGLSFDSVSHIQTNAYCAIYQTIANGTPYIVKAYRSDDPRLMIAEAKALDFYHEIASERTNLIDSRAVARNDAENLLCIQYVPGERLSDLIYQGKHNLETRARTLRIMRTLGAVLNTFYNRTAQPDAEMDAFPFEYFTYCSKRLEALPILGRVWFRRYEASGAALAEAFRAARLTPSFAHGDLVFRNIHVDGERVGLIDFANTNFGSHLLNDGYNLLFALSNMILSRSYRADLREALRQGVGGLSFPDIGHRFYYEYHRRRWLLLKLNSSSLGDLFQVIRGLGGFARSSDRSFIRL